MTGETIGDDDETAQTDVAAIQRWHFLLRGSFVGWAQTTLRSRPLGPWEHGSVDLILRAFAPLR
jgi:hypothetical protein